MEQSYNLIINSYNITTRPKKEEIMTKEVLRVSQDVESNVCGIVGYNINADT